MSTDTAFVLGILALFGPRCPDRLRLFLLTLAIVDDIGAISVMALFYTDDMHVPALLRRRGPRRRAAGPALGRRLAADALRARRHRAVAGRARLRRARHAGRRPPRPAAARPATGPRAVVERIKRVRAGAARAAGRRAGPPGRRSPSRPPCPPGARLLHALHRWTAYGVVPVFGLANAGRLARRRDPAARGDLAGDHRRRRRPARRQRHRHHRRRRRRAADRAGASCPAACAGRT